MVTTLQNVRRLAVELRPKALDDFGLVPALERLLDTFREQTGLAVDLEARIGEERLAPEIETALYRIVQEALTNVVKHAGARHVSVLLTPAGSVVAVVEDDGEGFAPERWSSRTRAASGSSACGARRARRRQARDRVGTRRGTTLVVEVPTE